MAHAGSYQNVDDSESGDKLVSSEKDGFAGGDVVGNDYQIFMDAEVRRGFIQKVYGILTVQLLITFGKWSC
jgi:hypothetical protein